MVSDKIKDLIGTAMVWTGIITLLLWALGKSFGIIHSPDWVGMLPYFSFVVVLMGASAKAGKVLEKIENIDKRVDNLDKRVDNLDKRLNSLCTAVIKIGKDVREIQRKAFCVNYSALKG